MSQAAQMISEIKGFLPPPQTMMLIIAALVALLSLRIILASGYLTRGPDRCRHTLLSGLGVLIAVPIMQTVHAALGAAIVIGFMINAVSARHKRPSAKFIARALALTLIIPATAALAAGLAPVLTMGPSMWPTSAKSPHISVLDTSAYSEAKPKAGHDIDFMNNVDFGDRDKAWPQGRFRKRVWAVEGDKIEIAGHQVLINGRVAADCSDRSRKISPTSWLCHVDLPSGKTDIVWGEHPWLVEPTRLRKGELFVIGDNTVQSSDSRAFGPIRAEWVSGRYR